MTEKAAKPDNTEQSKRFADMAKELEANETPEAMDEAFSKSVMPSGRRSRPSGKPASS